GAEPINPETMQRFSEAFKPYGFREEAFYPCYGLAEATLIVSGGAKVALPMVKRFNANLLRDTNRVVETTEADNVKELVGCGNCMLGQKIVIVNPKTLIRCQADEIGEIWVSGSSVAQGYWSQAGATERTFQAYLATGEGPFLRTGDLGFLQNGELFVTGRSKDLIIIRGLNHYPQDIELTVEHCHPALRPGCGAAFSIDVDNEERLVIVQEVDSKNQQDIDGIFEAIRIAVAEEQELQVYAIVLIKPRSIPKTSSGKIQRHACRNDYLAGSLELVAEWHANTVSSTEVSAVDQTLVCQSVEAVKEWLSLQIAIKFGLSKSAVDTRRSVTSYGIDSLVAIELAHDIESSLNIVLPMVEFLQDQSIDQLATEIFSQLNSTNAVKQIFDEVSPKIAVEQPLSHGQRALWFLNRLAPESPAYNLVAPVRINSALDIDTLKHVFDKLLNRHSSLRTSFTTINGEPVQYNNTDKRLSFQVEDVSGWLESHLYDRLMEEAYKPFNLEQDCLLRVNIFAKSKQECILLLVIHHIIADFWSLAILMHELGLLYEAERSCVPCELAPLKHRYADYVQWQLALLASEEGERLLNYWQKELSGELPILNLPTDRPRPTIQTYQGSSCSIKFTREITDQLKALALANGTTLFTVLLTAFQVLLQRYTHQKDILVGSPTAGRRWAQLVGLVGYLVNPVVIRGDFSVDLRFEELLAQLRQTVMGALEHQDYPFSLLVERLQPVRDLSRAPIFQVMFVLHKAHLLNDEGLASFALGEVGAQIEWGGMKLESIALEQRVAQFDLTTEVVVGIDGALYANLKYNKDLFDATSAVRMLNHYQVLLRAIACTPQQHISQLPLLTTREQYQLLIERNNTERSYAKNSCLHHLFEAQVERFPDAVAVIFENQQLTYRELNCRANQFAHYLLTFGIEPETHVAICLERSLELIIGLLGILKAGAAYLPLDPTYPKERLMLMLADGAISVVVTQSRLLHLIDQPDATIVCLDLLSDAIGNMSEKNPYIKVSGENLAYMIYTSGSTGRPKAVMINHSNVVNFFTGMDNAIGDIATDTILAVTSISFDISLLELFWTLTRGCRVVLLSEAATQIRVESSVAKPNQEIQFSLFYFASDESEAAADKYRLLFEGVKFADQHGFEAVWTPERHFHAFGGLYPNPAVTGAALAAITERVRIRAGSVVLPLHHPIRIAEEWSLVDNISKGRVDIAFASGWHADDFVFFPDNYPTRKELTFNGIETVQRLWQGETIRVRGGAGNELEVGIRPRPVQSKLSIWVTAAGSPETFIKAGEIGANILTHLLDQSIEEVAENI
ncbi:MAG: MupA/Atu3671 family FMN-dependent luciferase-like monooxygenase, partial [Acidobacteriota bacterium]